MKQFITLILLLQSLALFCQQTPFLHFFQQNWVWVNPAAVDKSFMFQEQNPFILHASYREQWIGVEGAPRNYYIGFEHKPAGDENFKWGFQFFNERTGNIATYGGFFNYAYSIKFRNTRSKRLHFGLNAGIVRYGIDPSTLKLRDPGDPIETNIDDIIYTDFSIGVFYQDNRQFYVGLSVPQTFSLDLDADNDSGSVVPERVPHIYFVAGGFIGESQYCGGCEPNFLFEPSIWVRYTPGVTYYSTVDNLPVSADFNIRAYLRRQFWLGAGFSTNQYISVDFGINKAIGGLLGETEDRIRLGLGYNLPIPGERLQLGHSLELSLGYSWN